MKKISTHLFAIVLAMVASSALAQQSPKSALSDVLRPIFAAPVKGVITIEGKEWVVEKRSFFFDLNRTDVLLKEKQPESDLCVQYVRYSVAPHFYQRAISSELTPKGHAIFFSTVLTVAASWGLAKYFNI